jgi:hypothetical protein
MAVGDSYQALGAHLRPPPPVRAEAQMSMLGAPVGPGIDPGLFDAKKSVVRSGEISGS